MQSNTQVLLSRKHNKHLLYIFVVFTILGTAGGVSGRLPSNPQQQSTPGHDLTPNMSFFSTLPVHLIGEMVMADGYAITLNQVIAQSENLALDITLTNNSAYQIDLNWTVKLYLPSGELVFPENQLQQEENILPIRGSLRRTWYYKFNDSMSKLETLSDWRLLYAPFGWSGPVILYRLSETAPEQRAAPHRQVAPSAYGTTGDPWKMLVLIYPNIDTDYVENGVSKHLTASMPAQDIENMKNDFLNLPHQNIVFSYSDGTAELESHVVVINRPLTDLEPINEGFWPSPDVTRQELDLYGPRINTTL